jgi:hypothetical protein
MYTCVSVQVHAQLIYKSLEYDHVYNMNYKDVMGMYTCVSISFDDNTSLVGIA